MRHRPLHSPQADGDALLGGQFLADHIGIARVPPEALLDPGLEAVQPLRAGHRRRPTPLPLLEPSPDSRARAAELG